MVALPLLPLVFLGYGTDVDAANVLSAADSLRAGDYQISRPPGSLPHELATALLDGVGGSIAVNLASLAMAVVLLVVFARVLRQAGSRYSVLAAVVLVANPFFIIAATSLIDHLWALALLVVGIWLHQSRRPTWAGIAFGLSIAIRVTTVGMVIAYMIPAWRDHRRAGIRGAGAPGSGAPARAALTAGTTLTIAIIGFLPAWLRGGTSADFLQNEFQFVGWTNNAGRWLVKNALFIGVPACLVLLAATPIVIGGLRRWSASLLIRFAAFGVLVSEAVFFRFPWKLGHLLPTLMCIVVILALSPKVTARYLFVLAAVQIGWGFVGFRTLVPDVPNAARSARIDLAITEGPLLTDVRCRLAGVEDVDAWTCTNSWWAGEGTEEPAAATPSTTTRRVP